MFSGAISFLENVCENGIYTFNLKYPNFDRTLRSKVFLGFSRKLFNNGEVIGFCLVPKKRFETMKHILKTYCDHNVFL